MVCIIMLCVPQFSFLFFFFLCVEINWNWTFEPGTNLWILIIDIFFSISQQNRWTRRRTPCCRQQFEITRSFRRKGMDSRFIFSSPVFSSPRKKHKFYLKNVHLQIFLSFNCCSKSELCDMKNQMSRPTNVKKNTKTKSKHWPPVSRRYNIWYETFESIDI